MEDEEEVVKAGPSAGRLSDSKELASQQARARPREGLRGKAASSTFQVPTVPGAASSLVSNFISAIYKSH